MTYILSTSKHARSGSAMQKMKARGEARRYAGIREVLPGFPVTRQFETEQEVRAYTEQPEITCLLCGRHFNSLANHLTRVHDMDGDDYRLRFGIPFHYSLAGTTLRGRRREIGLSAANQSTIALMLAKKDEYIAAGGIRPRPRIVPIVRKKMNEIVATYGGMTDRYTISDFDWHLTIAATVYHCRTVQPPEGVPSWSALKKRMKKSAELRKRFHEARANRPRWDQAA